MDKNRIIEILNSTDVKELLKEIWIIHLYLVWSYSRWDYNNESDVDLVYEKDKNIRVWWIKFVKNKTILEQKLNKKVDLVNIDYIYEDLKTYIQKDKILVY